MKTITALSLLWLGAVTSFHARAQPLAAKETQIKAVFLYNFALFATWPEHKLPDPSSPVIIGVLGKDPFGPFLDEIVTGEKIEGHPIEVRRLQTADEAVSCHILFIDKSVSRLLPEIMETIKGHDILTVSDMEAFTAGGGMIRFFIEEDKMRFEVNMAQYKSSQVVLSSRLLRLARICCE